MEFWRVLMQHGFLQSALLGGMLAGGVCGLVGPFIVMRRMGYIAGGIAHAVLGGVGFAYWAGFEPMYGALACALLCALLLAWIRGRLGDHEDSVISALWALGMASGVLFVANTDGYAVDLMTYLFGNILLIDPQSFWLLSLVSISVCVLVVAFYQPFVMVSFDEDLARMRGLPVGALTTLLYIIMALCVVALVQLVGLILVMALVSIPAVMARQQVHSFSRVIAMSVGICLSVIWFGLWLSYTWDQPTGATIIVLLVSAYFTQVSVSMVLNRKRAQ